MGISKGGGGRGKRPTEGDECVDLGVATALAESDAGTGIAVVEAEAEMEADIDMLAETDKALDVLALEHGGLLRGPHFQSARAHRLSRHVVAVSIGSRDRRRDDERR